MRVNKIHPISLKLLKQGHPWITKDKFSELFPKNTEIIEVFDTQSNKTLGSFLNDSKHPRIKARKLIGSASSLKSYIDKILPIALSKRSSKDFHRENYYLCFGEADNLPGLFIQKLGNHLLIQYHSYVWEKYINQIHQLLELKELGKYFWKQMRIPNEQKKPPIPLQTAPPFENIVNESGIKLKAVYNFNHDIGIYTDMSSIRKRIQPILKSKKNVLNLFSYTGAFTLQALKNGSNATSVDLSRKYMNWLEENISINKLDTSFHKSIVKACDKMLANSTSSYDCIICDPPSFSSNGKKRESSFDFYKKNWNLLWRSLSPGGHLIIFLNTHGIPRNKIKSLINEKVKSNGKITMELSLAEDCPRLNNFPEGDYLKGFVIQK